MYFVLRVLEEILFLVDFEEIGGDKMVLITEKKIQVGKYLLNVVMSKLKDAKPEKTLFLIPGGLGK